VTREDIATLFDRWREALQRHDVAALTRLYAEDCVVESPMAGGTVAGRTAVAKVYEALFAAFPDFALASDELLIDGTRVAIAGIVMGTDTGGFMGLQATHKPVSLPVVFLCQMADHRIVHERRIYDFTGLLVQLGVLKAKLA
jgi:steroid delta-isomerase-like uncharacterized protein